MSPQSSTVRAATPPEPGEPIPRSDLLICRGCRKRWDGEEVLRIREGFTLTGTGLASCPDCAPVGYHPATRLLRRILIIVEGGVIQDICADPSVEELGLSIFVYDEDEAECGEDAISCWKTGDSEQHVTAINEAEAEYNRRLGDDAAADQLSKEA